MLEDWGSVDGDGNADAIIADRREGRSDLNRTVLVNFAILIGCAVWYGLTESAAALALEIVAAAWLTGSGVQRWIYQTHTLVMIAERRIQLVEQKLARMEYDTIIRK